MTTAEEISMLKITGLSKTYPNGVRALRDVSLEIPNGMFGLLGPNGAGKSTLMRTIATLQEPDTGSITLNGIDVLRDKQRVREILGYLPQEFGVYPKVTAGAMLDHFAMLKGITDRGERQDVVDGLLRMTNLWEVRTQKLGTFSGGMRQRFGIAQALLGDPKLLIVDEPTAGLDPQERNRFLNLLSDIGENVVVILSTHIVDDVTELCTQMAIISEGRLLLTGDPREVIDDLRGMIWRKVVAKREIADIASRVSVISSRLLAGRTIVHVYSADRPGEGFEQVEPDLEDVYFTILKRQAQAA
jgi:ABC-type multidrug transport system ATPase subunit